MLKRREVIISILLFIPLITLTVVLRTDSFFVYGVATLFLYLLFACTVIYALIRVIRDRAVRPLFKKTKYLLTCSVLFMTVLIFSFFVEYDGWKKTSLMAGFHHDINFVQLKLYSDSSFSFLNAGPLGGTTYRGTYNFANDTLRLKCSHEELRRLYPSLAFVSEVEELKKILRPTDSASWQFRLFVNNEGNFQR